MVEVKKYSLCLSSEAVIGNGVGRGGFIAFVLCPSAWLFFFLALTSVFSGLHPKPLAG